MSIWRSTPTLVQCEEILTPPTTARILPVYALELSMSYAISAHYCSYSSSVAVRLSAGRRVFGERRRRIAYTVECRAEVLPDCAPVRLLLQVLRSTVQLPRSHPNALCLRSIALPLTR